MRPLSTAAAVALALLVALTIGCGDDSAGEEAATGTTRAASPGIAGVKPAGEPESAPAGQGTEANKAADGSTCEELAKTVAAATPDQLTEGADLVQLRLLQRDCPTDANQIGVADADLPPCERLSQSDCTFYEKP